MWIKIRVLIAGPYNQLFSIEIFKYNCSNHIWYMIQIIVKRRIFKRIYFVWHTYINKSMTKNCWMLASPRKATCHSTPVRPLSRFLPTTHLTLLNPTLWITPSPATQKKWSNQNKPPGLSTLLCIYKWTIFKLGWLKPSGTTNSEGSGIRGHRPPLPPVVVNLWRRFERAWGRVESCGNRRLEDNSIEAEERRGYWKRVPLRTFVIKLTFIS